MNYPEFRELWREALQDMLFGFASRTTKALNILGSNLARLVELSAV